MLILTLDHPELLFYLCLGERETCLTTLYDLPNTRPHKLTSGPAAPVASLPLRLGVSGNKKMSVTASIHRTVPTNSFINRSTITAGDIAFLRSTGQALLLRSA